MNLIASTRCYRCFKGKNPYTEEGKPKWGHAKTLGLVALLICTFLMALLLNSKESGRASNSLPAAAVPLASPFLTARAPATPPPLANAPGSPAARLQCAAAIREEFANNYVSALVAARESEKCLYVYYKTVLIDDAPQTFLRQQGRAGLKRLTEAGFIKIKIEANTEEGKREARDIPLPLQ